MSTLSDGVNIELFPCAGGMAFGFQQAGVTFDIAIELAPNHCDSYEANIGHRPINMDARDFLRLVKVGGFHQRVKLLVADPPCTPWSRSGKREGLEDPRDMLKETCEIIRILRPEAYLIGNVPGLDDGPNLEVVQRYIGGLSHEGYCTADFARLDAANYGVPQHRVRPLWFGHLKGPCIQWPEPTHGDPDVLRDQLTLPGVRALLPWVTCGQALKHLSGDDLGRPVRLRKRDCNGKQHGSIEERPARVVGTSNLSDGNVLLADLGRLDDHTGRPSTGGYGKRIKNKKIPGHVTTTQIHTMSTPDSPSKTITRNTHGDGTILINDKHRPMKHDEPALTIGAKARGQSGQVMTIGEHPKHAAVSMDDLSPTIRGGGNGHSAPQFVITETSQHPASRSDEPAMTLKASDGGGSKRVMRVRDVGRTGQGNRVGHSDKPSATVTSKASRVGAGEAHVLEWPWDRPSTTVQSDDRLSPPGHHDETFAVRSLANAVVISELAATILQGFPEDFVFVGTSKKQRWAQIGMAFPPPVARAVAESIVTQQAQADRQPRVHHQKKRSSK